MKPVQIIVLSIPNAGKTTLISSLTSLQGDIVSLGIYPCPIVDIKSLASKIKFHNTDIELIEHGANIPPILDNIDGLIVVISSMDLFKQDSYYLWNWAIATGLPCIAFINKIDLAMRAPKYLRSVQSKLKHTVPANQAYMYPTKESDIAYMKTGVTHSFPLLFGSATMKIGVFDLMKTMAQYFVNRSP